MGPLLEANECFHVIICFAMAALDSIAKVTKGLEKYGSPGASIKVRKILKGTEKIQHANRLVVTEVCHARGGRHVARAADANGGRVAYVNLLGARASPEQEEDDGKHGFGNHPRQAIGDEQRRG